MGTPSAAACPSKINVPTMALAMPPPGSPTGFGNWVKKAQFMELKPSFTRWIKHEHQRHDDQNRAPERDACIRAFLNLRQRWLGAVILKGEADASGGNIEDRTRIQLRTRNITRSTAQSDRIHIALLRFDARSGEGFQEQLRQRVDQHGHAEQHQADFKQRAQIRVGRGLGEFVGDDAGQRVARREKRFGNFGRLPMTIVTAMVSPSARPSPRITAPNKPFFA